MKNTTDFLHRFFALLQLVFPYVLIQIYLLLALEVYTYKGFISRYLFVNSDILFVLGIGLCTAVIVGKSYYAEHKYKRAEYLVFYFNRFISLPLITLYYLLLSLENSHFPNYVFSEYHLVPDNLNVLVSLNLIIFGIDLFYTHNLFIRTIQNKTLPIKQSILNIIYIVCIISFMVPQIQRVGGNIFTSNILLLNSLGDNYDEKMVRLLGGKDSSGWIYVYSEFIKKHSPEDAKIFIPPQMQSWEMEGNPWYFRWYVYPRKLLSAQKVDSVPPQETEYILIAHGTWIWGATDYGWPKSTIPADKIDKIFIINRSSLEESIIENAPYIPRLSPEQWGLIKLKENEVL